MAYRGEEIEESMKLKRFRVTNFRSVVDSGWIDVDDVTALIGVNESGKSNLLLALWKLKPANEGDIQPTSDYPKDRFGDIREQPGEFSFVTAEFDTGPLRKTLSQRAGISVDDAEKVRVTRFFDDEFKVVFPSYRHKATATRESIVETFAEYASAVTSSKALKQEEDFKEGLLEDLQAIRDDLPRRDEIEIEQLTLVRNSVARLVPDSPAKTSAIVPLVRRLAEELTERIEVISAAPPGDREDVKNAVIRAIPAFVYYAHYGNLDSEIYLPHVVENLDRDDLGTKEMAKARTLRVLFNFVRLEATEILELGNDPSSILDDDEAAEVGERKKERSILLQSASTTLTSRFRDWWRQGDHRFRFEADGNHFRIWVADDRRPTEVELENRSSGLQWFLSFYLVFLVESQEDHSGAVLLLDEPGMSLHPHAQRDLSAFFDRLSTDNQILYTSHSPFLVDADRLERARKVFVAKDGSTRATSDLGHTEGKDEQSGAAYAVFSALNLTVGESLLVGCRPVLVEGVSDLHYLTAIKSLLVAGGAIKPSRELVFVPSGGASNTRVIGSILASRDGTPPTVLLDSDAAGIGAAKALKSAKGLYAKHNGRVLSVGEFVDDVGESSEVEDLFPPELMARELDKMVREGENRLEDEIKAGVPFVEQVHAWATSRSIALPEHWKIDLALEVKEQVLRRGVSEFDGSVTDRWTRLFTAFERVGSGALVSSE